MIAAALPTIDVVVPLYNEQTTIRDLCASLSQQRGIAYRVFLVDNGSTDATNSIAQQFFEVFTCAIPGSYAARNYGASLGTAPYIAFTDGDCIPSPDWLDKICAEMEHGADVVSGVTRAGLTENGADSTLFRHLLKYRVEYYGAASVHTDATGIECSFPSCNVAYRREVFEALGGFPLTIGGDVALSSHAARSGYSCKIAREALVSHRAARSSAEIWQKFFLYSVQRSLSATQILAALTLLAICPVTAIVHFLGVYCRRRGRARAVGIPLSSFALFEALRFMLSISGLVYHRFRLPKRVY